MAWWTRITAGSMAGVQGHKTKLEAAIRLNFAVNAGGGAKLEDCGLYKRNPDEHPDEPNLLPAEQAKAAKRAARKRARCGR